MSFLVSKNAFQEVETDEISSFYYQKNYLPQSHIKVIEVLHKEIKNLVRHGKNHSKARL